MGIDQTEAFVTALDGSGPRKFLDRTNYFGQQATLDGQGRLLIHPLLRKSAEVLGDIGGAWLPELFGSLGTR